MAMVRAAGCLIALATVVSGWLAVVPPTAVGAFAGRNGKLVVEPVGSTSGLLVVDPRTGRTASICTDPLLCGRPVRPRFSPDGRDLVFVDSRSRRVGIVAADGPCLWCLLGRPLSQQPAAGPAFLASGGA